MIAINPGLLHEAVTALLTNFSQKNESPVTLGIPVRGCLPGEGLGDLPAGSRLLIIRLRSMGDTILLTPALRMLREWRPELRISVLLDRPWDELLAGNPAVDQILISDGKLSTLARIRSGRFAAVVNLHGGPTSALLTRLSGAARRIGMAQFRSPGAYNVLVPRMQDIFPRRPESGPLAFHTAEHAAAVFCWLGMPLRMVPAAQLFCADQARESIHSRLTALGMKAGRGYAVLHPAGLYPSKRWAPEGFAEIGSYLRSRYDLRPVLLGAKADLPLLGEIQAGIGAEAPIAAGWSIREMLALIAEAGVFLGNDSGPAHAAAALGVPTAVIFGSSSPMLWGPWRAGTSAIIQNHFDCNPCAGDRCHAFGEPRCIQSVEVGQVRDAADQLLGGR